MAAKVSGIVVVLVWLVGVGAVARILVGDFGSGLGSALFAMYLLATAVVALVLGLVGAVIHWRRYHERAVPIALAVTLSLGIVVGVVGRTTHERADAGGSRMRIAASAGVCRTS